MRNEPGSNPAVIETRIACYIIHLPEAIPGRLIETSLTNFKRMSKDNLYSSVRFQLHVDSFFGLRLFTVYIAIIVNMAFHVLSFLDVVQFFSFRTWKSPDLREWNQGPQNGKSQMFG